MNIPGSSDRYVKFLPKLVGFLGEKAQILHTWKIQVFCSSNIQSPICRSEPQRGIDCHYIQLEDRIVGKLGQ